MFWSVLVESWNSEGNYGRTVEYPSSFGAAHENAVA